LHAHADSRRKSSRNGVPARIPNSRESPISGAYAWECSAAAYDTGSDQRIKESGMNEVMTIDSVVLQEIRRKWPRHTLDTILDDRTGLSHVLEHIGQRCGVAVYGRIITGMDIVKAVGRAKS
jgi:hypothetical protein